MKLTFKEKAKLFWERNKAEIIGFLAFIGVTAAAGVVIERKAEQAEEKHRLEVEAWKAEQEKARQEELEEARKEEERIKNDSANQIAGGYVNPINDGLCDAEYPNILVNTVPVANMGELGQEVVRRLNEEWFGEFGETGEANPFDPATATVDVMIDFGHEVWKRNHPEEAAEESQEKQAS